MRWIAGVLAVAVSLPASAQQAGRYQVVGAPGNATSPPTVVLVDTATGQSWILVQTPGPPVQWAPVRFFTPGNPPTLAPTPPVAAAVGNRPAEAAR